MNWSIKDILTATGGKFLYGGADQSYMGIGIDSRAIDPDALFVAIRGVQYDAHAFLSKVVSNGGKGLVIDAQTRHPMNHGQWKAQGAACVVVEDTTVALGALAAFQRQQKDIPVLAITGSNGKTTTRRMAAAVLKKKFRILATEGNLNNEIGLPLTLFKLDRTHKAAILELGINHFGEMDRLGAICKPTMGIITNVGPAHLEFLNNLDGVAQAKGELLTHIDPTGYAILNKDDDHVAALAAQADCTVVFFGTSSNADIRADAVTETQDGIAFNLILPNEEVTVQLKTQGHFMVSNALAAATAGHLLGLSARQIQQGLESFLPQSGRLYVIYTGVGVKIIDDTYNANPDSMAAAIQTLSAMRKSARSLVVLGDMLELGDRSKQLHHQVGVLAAEAGAAKLYAFGDHVKALIAGARHGGMSDIDLFFGSKEEIVEDLIRQLRPQDWLLVKGSRGMAMESVVKDIVAWGDSVSE